MADLTDAKSPQGGGAGYQAFSERSWNSIIGAVIGAILLAILFVISRYNYLLFHGIAELFSIAVAWSVFLLVWNTRGYMKNDALVFLGISYLFIGFIDLMHTLAYKGMGVFSNPHASDYPTQLWISARGLETVSLLLFAVLIGRRFRSSLFFSIYICVTALLMASIFIWHAFPTCYVEGFGLTAFKKSSEYIFGLLLLAAIIILRYKRDHLDPTVYRLMTATMVLTIAAELFFTFYVSVYGISNLVGHYLKIISFFLIYLALIYSGLSKPYATIFRALTKEKETLRENEEKYRHLYQEMAQGVVYQDADGQITSANPSAERILGLKLDEMKGLTSFAPRWRAIHEDGTDFPGKTHPSIVALSTGKEVRNTIMGVFNPKINNYNWININAVPQFKENETKPCQVFTTFEDITQLKWADDELKLTLNATTDGIWKWSFNTNELTFNRRYYTMLGYEPGAFPACFESWKALIHPEDLESTLATAEAYLKTKPDVYENEFRLKTKTGEYRWVNAKGKVVARNENGEAVRMIGNHQDITKRKKALSELQLQKELLEGILDALKDVIAVQLPDHTILRYNQAGYEIFGIEADEIKGKKCYELIGKTKPCEVCATSKAIATKTIASVEKYVPELNRHIVATSNPILDKQGNVKYIIEQLSDITQQKRSEEALKESEEKYRLMMESMVDPLYICKPDFTVAFMNSAMIQRIGRDATGEICHIAMHDLKEKCEWCVFDKVTAGESVEINITSPKDGRNYRINNMPIHQSNGKVSKMSVFRDITDYLLAVEEKEKVNIRLIQAQKMEAIGTLSGGIAHDFNNILSPLIGFTELLKEDLPEDHSLHEYVDEIFDAALRSRDLVKQILMFSRKNNQEIKPVKLQPIIKEAMKLLRSTIPKTIDIQQDIDPDCGIVLTAPTQIHQVVMNLAINAYHAMQDTGGRLRVTLKQVRLEVGQTNLPELVPGEYALLTITDTGTGIEKSVLDKIFDPYFTTKSKNKGTGLGLSVVHGIIKACRGDIRIHSEPGKGTKFQVYLPIKGRETKKKDTHAKKPSKSGTEKILLVDDEEAIIRMEQQILERLGYHVTARKGSIEALEAFKASPDAFDLVITDMSMPNMTGSQLASEIKQIKPDMPIIICTGFSEHINQKNFQLHGIQAYAMKPVLASEISEAIRKVLDKPA